MLVHISILFSSKIVNKALFDASGFTFMIMITDANIFKHPEKDSTGGLGAGIICF